MDSDATIWDSEFRQLHIYTVLMRGDPSQALPSAALRTGKGLPPNFQPASAARVYVCALVGVLVPNGGNPLRGYPSQAQPGQHSKSARQRNNNFSATKFFFATPPTMTSNTAPHPPTTTTIAEPYHAIENRITQGIDILLQRGGKPNISATAREFKVPEQRFRARWNGRKSKQEVVPWNRKLKEHEELAVCTYLNRLDKIGLHARLFMIADCAKGVLRRAHVGEGPPLQGGEHWARRFLE